MMRRTFMLTLFFVGLLGSCIGKKAEDAIYLIPEGFEGNIVVVFNATGGQKAAYEHGKRIYKFDKTGILKTQFSTNYGIQQDACFYIDSAGARTPLEGILRSGDISDSNKVVCFNQETGNWFNDRLKTQVHIEVMTVARKKNLSFGVSKEVV